MTKQEKLDKFHARDFSWSQYSCWADKQWGSPEKWYKQYIYPANKLESEELTFGSYIDKKIQNDPTFMPLLPRYENMQYKMKVILQGIPLVGLPDGVNLSAPYKLADYKTGKVKWNRTKAQETGQLKFYLLLLYITHNINPKDVDCYIHWLPTKLVEDGNFNRVISLISEMEFQTFQVKHTLMDILNFANDIKKVYAQMEKYIEKKG